MESPEGGSFVVYPKQSETRLVTQSSPIPEYVDDELAYFEEQIHKYRSGHVAERKMQKLRLTFGTYAQRRSEMPPIALAVASYTLRPARMRKSITSSSNSLPLCCASWPPVA